MCVSYFLDQKKGLRTAVDQFYSNNFLLSYFSAISWNFLGVLGFWPASPRKKSLCSWGIWGHCKSCLVESKVKNFGYFAFWIAQNISLVGLRDRTVTKAYIRNQRFWEFSDLNWDPKFRCNFDQKEIQYLVYF